jgi:hypothetical protein
VSARNQATELHLELEQAAGISGRVLRVLPAEPARPLALHTSWPLFAAVAVGLNAVLAAGLWMSAHLHPDPVLQKVALFVHLASLVIGLGAVLVADYLLILWFLRRSTFAAAVQGASKLHVPIWIGVAGLVFSGVLLEPDLSATTARVKFTLVAVLTLNGLQATVLSERVKASANSLSLRLLTWGGATTTVSQLCWWGSVVIGFLTANQR